MSNYIDEDYWNEALSKPDWYILLSDDFKRLEKLAAEEKDANRRKEIKQRAYELVESAVEDGRLPMAAKGDYLDAERKPIDTVVIHHSSNQPGMTLERLNAMQLLRIYGQYFANPSDPKEKHLKGQPIWSNHFYKSKQVFWGYHWLIREDGTAEHILDDSYIGWHAGNWDINTRSVGICIDDDLSAKAPSDAVLSSMASVIRKNYPNVKLPDIVGHRDVSDATVCPGDLFHKSWRNKLLMLLGQVV